MQICWLFVSEHIKKCFCKDAEAQSCLKRFLSLNVIKCSDILLGTTLLWNEIVMCTNMSKWANLCRSFKNFYLLTSNGLVSELPFCLLCYKTYKKLCLHQTVRTFQKLLFNNSLILTWQWFFPAAETPDIVVLLQHVQGDGASIPELLWLCDLLPHHVKEMHNCFD